MKVSRLFLIFPLLFIVGCGGGNKLFIPENANIRITSERYVRADMLIPGDRNPSIVIYAMELRSGIGNRLVLQCPCHLGSNQNGSIIKVSEGDLVIELLPGAQTQFRLENLNKSR